MTRVILSKAPEAWARTRLEFQRQQSPMLALREWEKEPPIFGFKAWLFEMVRVK